MFDSARAKEHLTLMKLCVTGTSTGQVVEKYMHVASFYGSITTRRGNNSFDTGNRYIDTISFYCRYMRGVETPFQKKQYRLCYNGSTYDVVNITSSRIDNYTVIEVNGIPE